MHVTFKNLGRGKLTFTHRIEDLTHDALYHAVHASHALRSQDIEFTWNPETQTGAVIVGGFRTVGTFSTDTPAPSLN